ncbi:MAG: hypothetical protein F4160_11190 [Rhodospirillaceae bacterium]|nr:hypothetical protein [Rhodospirillaceae bacterium]
MSAKKPGRPRKPEDEKIVKIGLQARHVDLLDAMAGSATAEGRRAFLGHAIERLYADRWAAEISFAAPCIGKAADFEDAAEWQAREGARLTAEAPKGVKRALARNRFFRLAEDDPDAAIAMMESGGDA